MTIHDLNHLPPNELREALFRCCGANNWVNKMLAVFPVEDYVDLTEDAEENWWKCSPDDWKEAFAQHPKIGDIDSLKKKFASTSQWASGEQTGVTDASDETIRQLAALNQQYEEKFGYIFIICATGKSAEEMLVQLQQRLQNDPEAELEIAADNQMQITRIRLAKLLDVDQ